MRPSYGHPEVFTEFRVSVISVLFEAESIHILREVVAEFSNPVMLYSVGKDSSVMTRLAQKAFHPARIPFPFCTSIPGDKFKEMYEFRDNLAKSSAST
jgi:sulfate adenylyltransferase subunit 2